MAKEKERTLRILSRLDVPGGKVIVRITVGKEVCDYEVNEIEAQFGRGFRVRKCMRAGVPVLDKPYHVFLERGHASCECWGYLKMNECRHTAALQVLIENAVL